jgi:hypothetical protein
MDSPSLRSLRRSSLGLRTWRILRSRRPSRRPLVTYSTVDPTEPFRVVIVGSSEFFTPYRDAMLPALRSAGADVDAVNTLDRIDRPESVHAVLVIGPHEHTMRRHRRRLSRSVLAAIQTEQLPTRRQGGYATSSGRLADMLAWSPHYDLIVEWSRDALPLLHRLGLNALHLPHGHLDLDGTMDRTSTSSPVETHDLLFLGGLGGPLKRRRRIMAALGERFTIHPATGTKVWGEAKVRALRESRVVLNLHSEQSQAFASPRFFETLSLGRPLVSEGVADPWPFVPDVDFATTTLPGLEERLTTVLRDEELRLRLAASGHARTLEHPLEDVARRILSELLAIHRSIAA